MENENLIVVIIALVAVVGIVALAINAAPTRMMNAPMMQSAVSDAQANAAGNAMVREDTASALPNTNPVNTCGNKVCESIETCSTCSTDCGACVVSPTLVLEYQEPSTTMNGFPFPGGITPIPSNGKISVPSKGLILLHMSNAQNVVSTYAQFSKNGIAFTSPTGTWCQNPHASIGFYQDCYYTWDPQTGELWGAVTGYYKQIVGSGTYTISVVFNMKDGSQKSDTRIVTVNIQ